MDIYFRLVLTALSGAAFFLMALSVLKLETFSRARLRKLRELSRPLGEDLEDDLQQMDRCRLTGHFVLLLTAGLAFFLLASSLLGQASLLLWIVLALSVFLAFVLLQVLNEQLSLLQTGRLLHFHFVLCRIAFWLFAPLLFLPDLYLRRLRDAEDEEDEVDKVTAEDEILSLVEEAEEDTDNSANAGLEQDERRMLNGVINLDKTLVHEIMTPRVDLDVVSEQASPDELKATIARSGHSRIPVYSQTIDTISGIVYAKDLLDEQRLAQATCAGDLAHQAVFIPESKNISDLLEEFRRNRHHLAVVLDEYGGTAGVVTIEDILEEIVGEIQDEYDHNEPIEVENPLLPDGSLINDGRMTIWEINQLFDLDIPEDQGFDTIGGYILAELGRIPRTGEKVQTKYLDIEIFEANPRKLLSIRISTKNGEDGVASDSRESMNNGSK